FRALVACGLASAVLGALWRVDDPGPPAWLRLTALGFPAFSIGILWSEPRFVAQSAWRWVVQNLPFAVVFLAPEWLAWSARQPLVAGVLGLALGAGLLWLPFRSAAVRARVAAADSLPIRSGAGSG